MPRMGDFWRRFPEISVDHLISDDAREFRRAEVDLRIRYGFGAWPDETSIPADDRTPSIRSPAAAFARQHADCAAADIPELPLLHVDWADAEWTGWDELLRRAGIPHGALPGRRFSTLGVVLQACQEDQGVAVGWHRLVRPTDRRRPPRALHRPADARPRLLLPQLERERRASATPSRRSATGCWQRPPRKPTEPAPTIEAVEFLSTAPRFFLRPRFRDAVAIGDAIQIRAQTRRRLPILANGAAHERRKHHAPGHRRSVAARHPQTEPLAAAPVLHRSRDLPARP